MRSSGLVTRLNFKKTMRHKYFFVAICKVFKQKLKPFVGFFANLGGVAWRHVPISDENNTKMSSLAGIKKRQGH